MKEYYFYCPNCKAEYIARSLPEGTVANIRDGYGTPIHHYECHAATIWTQVICDLD